MRRFFDARQLAHAPLKELHNGGFADYAERPSRAQAMAAALGELEAPTDHGDAAIRAVHTPAYLDFLKTAPANWAEAGRPGDVMGYVWPIVGRRPLTLRRIDALVGQHSFDASTPLTADTYDAAYWSAQSALSALAAVQGGDRAAFALCRPPGHHAGADYLGGYCYLNTAAITAQTAIDAGVGRVAILDVDYHHGNGTQDIFYDRGDVFYASLHADPATDYPFYWGHADERGAGAGLGANLNLPLPQGTAIAGFRPAQATALDAIAAFRPELLVVSFGADTWEGDPISQLNLATADYPLLAADIAARGWPTVILMEGGYAVDALGNNVAGFLSGFRA
ncbi:MAG: acetylpolyamine amidohydrolase [Sphingomonas sp. 28-62-20]|uniref:histone deacetylase family protein n=1 Tax=Sphingomonas sp. 28-62-20 TaxID=1970433 RepID=UPI000BCB6560|nr:MAG: acetylpolyamine amidohydrolase [Sphingomonas sp. 28-62-20]